MYKLLARIINDPELIRRYGSLAEEYAKKHYAWSAVTDAYEQLFYDVLEE